MTCSPSLATSPTSAPYRCSRISPVADEMSFRTDRPASTAASHTEAAELTADFVRFLAAATLLLSELAYLRPMSVFSAALASSLDIICAVVRAPVISAFVTVTAPPATTFAVFILIFVSFEMVTGCSFCLIFDFRNSAPDFKAFPVPLAAFLIPLTADKPPFSTADATLSPTEAIRSGKALIVKAKLSSRLLSGARIKFTCSWNSDSAILRHLSLNAALLPPPPPPPNRIQ
mmetsp:Transcript_19499/g.31786  ORF Transcript_19499/g.31786 Transcript_19499/m.31786 type:complete len:231 (-) Transcript_19499:307-999(-)